MYLLAVAAHAAAPLGELEIADAYASESIELAATLGTDPPWDAYQAKLQIAMMRGDTEERHRWWVEGRRASQASGVRYFELLHESHMPFDLTSEGLAQGLAHYERLLPEVRSYGAPLLIALTEGGLARVLFALGEAERAREVMRSAVAWAELAGPAALTPILLWEAICTLVTGVADAAEPLSRALRLGRDEGNTFHLIYGVIAAAAIAMRCGEPEASAALLAGATRLADPHGLRGDNEYQRCRVEAEDAVAAYPGDLAAARARGGAMTIDDLVDEALRVAAP